MDQIGVFISYSHSDRRLARDLAERLKAAGYRIWIDEMKLRAGDSLIGRIATAIEEMEFLIALITASSVRSKWCQKELALAMTGGLNREGVKVLPVRVDDVPIPATLVDTYCRRLDPEELDVLVEELVADIRSHHEDRRRAQAAGETLPTTGSKTIAIGLAGEVDVAGRVTATVIRADEPVRIIGIVKEGIGQPRNDGTPGSALYRIPLRLSRAPSTRWGELFLQCWDNPPSYSSMHRPGTVRVVGDTIVLTATTLKELDEVHARTLKLCTDHSNQAEAALVQRDREEAERKQRERRDFQREIDEVSDRIRFDDARRKLLIEDVGHTG